MSPKRRTLNSNHKLLPIHRTRLVIWFSLVISIFCFWYVQTRADSATPMVPPSVSITSPANGASLTAPANIVISASATDTDGTISKVEFFQGTTKLGQDLSAPYILNWNSVGVGSYSLTAKATDNAGETTTSSPVNITVVNTPPTVTLISPTNGSSYSVPANVSLIASAADTDGAVTKVQFFNGGTLLGTDLTAPYTINWYPAVGSYVLTAKATDNAGAVTTSSSVSFSVIEMTVTPESLACPGSSSPNEYNQIFTEVGQKLFIPINLAPCQTIAVNWTHLNPGNRGTTLTFTYYNYGGRVVHTKSYDAIALTSGQFPQDARLPFPWAGTIGLEGLPMYLIVESANAVGYGHNPSTPPEYSISVAKQSRPGYNTGGRSFDTAVQPASFPASYYGSLLTLDQGQFFKVTLQGNQSLYFTGYAEGSTIYTGRYVVDIVNSARTHRWTGFSWTPDNASLPAALVYHDATGVKDYVATFTNPSSSAADYYIRLTARSNFNVFDFRLNLLLNSANISSLAGLPQNGTTPLQVTFTPPNHQLPITLVLRTLSGTGKATFADGSTQMTITQTTTVQIKGVTQSSAADNIRLEAKDGDVIADFEDFTVTAEQCSGPPAKPVAPDATPDGPYGTAIFVRDYQFPAGNDPEVLTTDQVEIWARMWRPTDLSAGPFPLAVFLHGNNGTCGRDANPRIDSDFPFRNNYTTTGRCPVIGETETVGTQTFTSNFNYEVVPNHLGYDYLARKLASWGYIVVSINANRGITLADDSQAPSNDPGYIDARGALVLRHLQRLSEWNTNGGAPVELGNLQGRINFDQVGLMGHSRGGEGMRSAYNLYRQPGNPWPARIPNLKIRGIFEFAPTDRGDTLAVQAEGTAWSVVLPMCDGDLVDLQGVRPFDRMMRLPNVPRLDDPPTQKSTFTIWGANHNYFNSEWQEVEPNSTCTGTGNNPLPRQTTGSNEQRQIAMASLVAFFRANVGVSPNPALNQNFNPLYALPPIVTSVTRVEQGFTPSPSSLVTRVFDDFAAGTGSNPAGVGHFTNHANVTKFYGQVHDHDETLDAALIEWTAHGPDKYFQSNWTSAGVGNDIGAYQTLDFRVSRRIGTLNPATPTNFTIQLVMADGSVSNAVPLCKYADLRGPVGGPTVGGMGGLHPILQTVRIPLTDFVNANLSQVRGVRFVFNVTSTGSIYLANLRLSR